MNIAEPVTVERKDLNQLFDALKKSGYKVLGPTLRDRAIVYDELDSVSDLPIGWTDEQEAGSYRIKKRNDEALFGYAVGPHSWKKFFFPPLVRLWQSKRAGAGFQILEQKDEQGKLAFLGVRACELSAIAVQDQVFLGGKYVDSVYKARREKVFVVAVNCGQAGKTCFCASMKTGPKSNSGYDLALTELLNKDHHRFLVEIGTESGVQMMSEVEHREADDDEKKQAQRVVETAEKEMGRTMDDPSGLRNLLTQNSEHPRWEEVAKRCLACANCTMACPTCFCSTVEDATDLKGEHAERWRKWDSCFSLEFSYMNGGTVRSSVQSRYRQWITHKLAAWEDQFGRSGCVGCGRCITWCPVGIDITEEARFIRGSKS